MGASTVQRHAVGYQRPWRKHPVVRAIRTVAFYLLLLILFIPFFFVFAWMIMGAFKTQMQNTAIPPLFIFEPTLRNFETVFQRNPMWQFLLNSAIIGLGATLLGLIIGLPAAYTIARYKQQKLAVLILVARIMPGISYLVPWFILFSRLKLTGTYWALILSHLLITLPMTIWLMIGFFEDIPPELDDAAMIDGCSHRQAFLKVSLPLVKPGIAAAAILSFIFSWNNFLFSLILANQQTRPLPVAVFSFISYTQIDWGGLNAAATIVTLPVLILILFAQKHMVRGLTLGSVKG
jgi:multiple sugar transport system permease protein